jgi:ribosomal protein L4
MLFPNLNLADIFKAVKEFFKGRKKEEFKKEDKKYKDNAKKLLDYYNGDQIPYLKGVGFEDKTSGDDIIRKMTLNITKKIIDKVSMVYKYTRQTSMGEDGKICG